MGGEVFVTVPCCCDQLDDKYNFKEELLILAHSFRVSFIAMVRGKA